MQSVSVGEKTYSKAVQEGKYDLYAGNLFGKYDSVRTYWEDQLTRILCRPFLREIVERCHRENRGIRILDLGCGSGQGYELLTKIDCHDLDLGLQHQRVLYPDDIELYLGLDISQAMVDKGQDLFKSQANVNFAQQDLREGLGKLTKAEDAFDIYFSSYAALSHLSRQELFQLITEIAEHGSHRSMVVLDFVGRYSIEWPEFWTASSESEKVRNYSMSYLYSEEDRKTQDIEQFPLRFWTGAEVQELADELTAKTGTNLEVLKLMDRSVLVGRHTNTREFNPNVKQIRSLVNSLHEDYLRTDLQALILDPAMFPEHDVVSPFLQEMVQSWNVLVEYCQKRLTGQISLTDLELWHKFPTPLQFALMTMDRVIADVSWMWYGDSRANIIEPQLGYALRTLEYEMQRGMGCSHGLVAVLEIRK